MVTVVLGCANGAKDFRTLALVNIGTGVSSLVLITALSPSFGVFGAVLAMALLPLASWTIAWAIARRHDWWPRRPLSNGFDPREVRRAVAFVPMAVISAVGLPLLQILIRDSVADHSGMAAVGLLQGVVRISDMYLGVATTVFAMYYFPRFSEIRDADELVREAWKGLAIIVPSIAAVSLVIYLLRDLIIHLIFTPEFAGMRDLFGWQMLGNTLKMVGWLFGYLLLAKANALAMAGLEAASIALWWLLSIYLISLNGTIGAPQAYVVAYALYSVATFIGVAMVVRRMRAQSRRAVRMTAQEQAAARQPLVTAVLVCWNHVRFLRAAVESVLQQTYRNIQLIVFDNGSTDGSRDALEALQAEHGFTLRPSGQHRPCTNAEPGLGMAQGEFIACLSTDDAWLPQKTAAPGQLFRSTSRRPPCSGPDRVDRCGWRADPGADRQTLGRADLRRADERGRLRPRADVMCRTAILRELGGYDETVRIEDYTLVLKLTHLGYRIVVLPDSLTLYRYHGANWTAKSVDAELYEMGLLFARAGVSRLLSPSLPPLVLATRQGRPQVAGAASALLRACSLDVGKRGTRNDSNVIPYSLIRGTEAHTGRPPEGQPCH